ncbi:sporulation protein YpjB [Tuberibacillus sp. Marseille-P3662]|uniref:sporulation protein YpjB n=1 Tax=Tuberibacillus sp. Marseille-P3662 TaxID=1965358 RepID=UPI000A1CB39C|nr:sporulation protein YpjB [Tuberibacillus sp. Marseille-P3662]
MKGFVYCGMTLLFILLIPATGLAKEPEEAWDKLSDLSDQVFQLTESGHYPAAADALHRFEEQWEDYSELTKMTPDNHERILKSSIGKLEQYLDSLDFDKEEKQEAATEFRLVVNALTDDSTPMWMQFHDDMNSHFERMTKALKADGSSQFQYELNQFMNDYDMLYPSMLIDVDQSSMRKVQQAVQDLATQSDQLSANSQSQSQSLKTLENRVQTAFEMPHSSNKNLHSFQWTALPIGGLIILTLLYVAWRKYQGEKSYSIY